MNTQSISLVRGGSIALVALVLLALAVFPSVTRAADFGDYGYGDYYSDFGSDYGYGDYYADDYGYGDYYASESDYGYGDYYQDDYGYGDYYQDEYGYQIDSGYSSQQQQFYPSYYPSSSYYSSVPSYRPAPSNSTANTCTAPNTCNTNIDDHSIVNFDDHSVFNAPTVVTVTDYSNDNDNDSNYSKKSKKNYDNDYNYSYRPPVVAYNPAPYVSLSAAPYTGLELGPVGTAVYWGFLVLWSLVAAYLIVVKRVQVTLFRKLNAFLFGEGKAPAQVAFAGTSVAAPVAHYSAPVTPKADSADDFILRQISRGRNA